MFVKINGLHAEAFTLTRHHTFPSGQTSSGRRHQRLMLLTSRGHHTCCNSRTAGFCVGSERQIAPRRDHRSASIACPGGAHARNACLDLAQQVDEVLHAARPAVALHLLLHLPRQPPQRRRPLPQRLRAVSTRGSERVQVAGWTHAAVPAALVEQVPGVLRYASVAATNDNMYRHGHRPAWV